MLYTPSNPDGLGGAPHKFGLDLAVQHQIVWARQEEVSDGKYKSAPSHPLSTGHGFTHWLLLKAGEQSRGVAAV